MVGSTLKGALLGAFEGRLAFVDLRFSGLFEGEVCMGETEGVKEDKSTNSGEEKGEIEGDELEGEIVGE